MRKFISLLSAAAVAATVVVVPMTASAEDPVFSLDGSSVEGWEGSSAKAVVSDDNGDYLAFAANGSSNYSISYALPAAAQLEDNYVIEYDVNIHKSNGMGRYGRLNQIAFVASDATLDSRDYGAYATSIGQGNTASETGQNYVTGVASALTGRWGVDGLFVNETADVDITNTDAAENIPVDTWVRVQTAISGTTATVTVIDSVGTKYVDAKEFTNSASALSKIYITTGRGDADQGGPGTISLDNVKIYEGAAEELTTDGLRGEAAVVEAVAAPAFAAHATAQKLFSQTFNAVSAGNIVTMAEQGQEYTDIDGLVFKVGGRAGATDTFAEIAENVESDNVVNLVAGQYATAGRGVRMALADDLSIADDTSLTSIMAFAFKLDAAALGGKGQLYLFDNDTNVDDNGVARDILAVFTTDGNAANYTNGSTQIGINVTAGEWHRARIAVSNGSYRVYLDDDTDNPAVKAEKVSAGDSSKAVTHLPMIATTNSRANDGSNRSLVTVDNVMAYQISSAFEKKYLPSVADTQEDVIPGEVTPTTAPAATEAPSTVDTEVEASAKAATKVENDELRISDGTNGAVFKFDLSGYENIESVKLVVKAASRSYDSGNYRWGNTQIITYRVKSAWSDTGNEISGEDWNKLSKDELSRSYSDVYPDKDGTAVAPYKTFDAIDVTDKIDDNGVVIFAFKTGSAREHAIDATLVVTTKKPDVWTLYKAEKDANGILTNVTAEVITDLASVTLGTNEYLWNQDMVPYKAE